MATSTHERAFEFSSMSTMVGAFEAYMSTLPPGRRIQACQLTMSCCEAIQTAAASEFVADDGDIRAAERALSNPKSSKREVKQAAKRAAAVAKSPVIAAKVKSKELSKEQVDAVVRADARTDGAASADAGLLDDLAGASADETGAIIDKFIVDQANADSVQKEHDRQRGLRSVRRYRTRLGLSAISIAGDDATIDAAYKQAMADANQMFKKEGGRDGVDLPGARTRDQRMFDAATARLTGIGTVAAPNGAAANAAGEPEAGAAASGGAAARPRIASKRYTPPAVRRPTVVVVVGLDKLTGADPSLVAEQIGVGPIADSVLAAYIGNTTVGVDFVGAVFGKNGHPLWLGRTARYASDAQFLALVIRDKGCVDCGASADQCQAHHRIPWNAPAKGETNLEDLALMCTPCHTRLHQNLQTLHRHPRTGRWTKRPATPNEIAPPRPTTQPAQPRGPDRRTKPTPTSARPHPTTTQTQLPLTTSDQPTEQPKRDHAA